MCGFTRTTRLYRMLSHLTPRALELGLIVAI